MLGKYNSHNNRSAQDSVQLKCIETSSVKFANNMCRYESTYLF